MHANRVGKPCVPPSRSVSWSWILRPTDKLSVPFKESTSFSRAKRPAGLTNKAKAPVPPIMEDSMAAELVCFAEKCRARFPITEVIYNCPKCGGLLEAAYDTPEQSALMLKRL